ncbi:MAG: hypothetical protein P8J45_12185 [Phycisphaerales bacterium]|jgi:hypothetical protein|nr:hypothetical protein [Phycisphaerales bacterium]
MRIVLHVLSWLVLSLWLATIVSPGVAAISAFTQLPAEGASIAVYEPFFADDRAGMGRMVAGYVTDPIFSATDAVQWLLAPAALLLALLEWRPFRITRGIGQLIRILAVAAALALVVLHNASMAPRMSEQLTAYRVAAAKNQPEKADAALAAFDEDHRLAESLFGVRMLLVLVAIGASAGATALKRPGTSEET